MMKIEKREMSLTQVYNTLVKTVYQVLSFHFRKEIRKNKGQMSFVLYFEAGSHCAILTGLELAV